MHTDLVLYTIILHYCVSAQMSVYPGEEFQLAVKATDELDRPTATILRLSEMNVCGNGGD